MVEKPLASGAASARAIVEMACDQGVALLVNYNRRWDPLHGRVKQLIADGHLGAFQGGVGHYVRGLKHNGTTLIQTLRWLLAENVLSVRAVRAVESSYPGDLALDGILEFESGAAVWIQAADKSGYGHSVFELDLMGNAGRLRLHDNGFQIEISKTGVYHRYPGVHELVRAAELEASLPDGRMRETLVMTLDEVAGVLDRCEIVQDVARDACLDLEIVEALERSWREGGVLVTPGMESR